MISIFSLSSVNAKTPKIVLDSSFTVTPSLRTSSGSKFTAEVMRLFTFTLAVCGSVPVLKYTFIFIVPVDELVLCIYIISSTPFIASSRGAATVWAIVAASAPL